MPQRVDQLEARSDRPFRVVVVRDRDPEHGHDRIADELLHRSPVPDQDLVSQGSVSP
jgi:hypothetical protein